MCCLVKYLLVCAAVATPGSLAAQESKGPHVLEVFLGTTYADHHGESEHAFSVGVQYGYEIKRGVSVGVLAEYATNSLDAWVVGIPAVVNLGETPWQVTLMPGAELVGDEQEFLFRTGIGYEFEMQGGYALKPEVNLDWVDGETSVVAGVAVGFRF